MRKTDFLSILCCHSRMSLAGMTVFALLTGCVTFHPKPLLPEKTATDFEARTLQDPGLKAFMEANLQHPLPAWPLHLWNLDTLTLAAFYYHPDLDIARAQWAVARASQRTASERPNPSFV